MNTETIEAGLGVSPYSIQCKTCLAKLKVRKAKAIGSLVHCPKCGAMVMISPPPPPGMPDSITESAICRPAPLDAKPAAEETFDQISAILDQPPTPSAGHVTPEPEQPPARLEPRKRVNVSARSVNQRPRRRWMLVGAGLAGALLVFAVFQTLSGDTPPQKTLAAVRMPHAPTPAVTQDHLNQPVESPVELLPHDQMASDTSPQASSRPTTPIPPAELPPSLIDQISEESPPHARPASSNDAARLLQLTYTPGRGPASAPSTTALIERLRMPIGFKCDHQAFPQFIATLEKLTEAPITVDSASFVSREPNLIRGITFDSGTMPLGRAMAGSLKPVGLKIGVSRGYMRISARQDDVDESPRFAKHEISDLLTTTQRSRSPSLLRLLRQFVSPEVWSTAGGSAEMALTGDVLMVEGASTEVHHEIRRFCEQLRSHRGLQRLSNTNRIDGQPVWLQAAPMLQRELTLHIAQPTRLDEALRRLATKSETQIWPNWKALSEVGVAPGGQLRLEAEQMPLEDVLDALSAKLGIGYRIAGPRVLELTSPSAASSDWETVFHRVNQFESGASPHELIGMIYDEIGSEWFAPARGAIEWDADSRCLIARLPQRQQRRVSRLLMGLSA